MGNDKQASPATTGFHGAGGVVEAVNTVRVQMHRGDDGALVQREVAGTASAIPADLVLLAMGFVHPVHEGLLADLGVTLDAKGNVQADNHSYRTSVDRVFAVGDMRRGQSLVVWAIAEGRGCARAVDLHLSGDSDLPA